jgi:hypothetical protein
MFQQALMNASMCVREEANDESGVFLWLGSISSAALRQALHELAIKGFKLKQEHRKHIASLAMKQTSTAMEGKAFEEEVQLRLELGCLSPRAWNLATLGAAAYDRDFDLASLCEAHRSEAFSVERPGTSPLLRQSLQANPMLWQAGTPLPGAVLHLRSSEADAYTRVDAAVSRAIKECIVGDCVLISTATNFPALDFVMYKRGPGNKNSVVFVEATKSSLASHASGNASRGAAGLHSCFNDMLCIMKAEHPVASRADGAWHWATPQSGPNPSWGERSKATKDAWTRVEDSTLVNMWLRILGCPLRVQAEVGEAAGTKYLSLTLVDTTSTAAAASAAAASSASAESWTVSVLYVSCGRHTGSDLKELRQLESDFVYELNVPPLQFTPFIRSPDQTRSKLLHKNSMPRSRLVSADSSGVTFMLPLLNSVSTRITVLFRCESGARLLQHSLGLE